MGWIDSLQGQIVGLDTAPLVYYIERNPGYIQTIRPFFEALEQGEFTIVTSMITLLEVLVHPIRHGNAQLAQEYRDILLNTPHLTTVIFSQDIAEEAARLRSIPSLRTPDAIQIATATQSGAMFFITNDIHLSTLPHIKAIVLDAVRS